MKLQRKSESRLMKLIAKLPFVPKTFMSHFWTTIGETVYVPTRCDDDPDWGTAEWCQRKHRIIDHELVHVSQFRKFGMFLMACMYLGPSVCPGLPLLVLSAAVGLWWGWAPFFCQLGLIVVLLPLSIGLAYGRWWIERSAYLLYCKTDGDVEWIADSLWKNYAWTWPRPWARAWLSRHRRCNGSDS